MKKESSKSSSKLSEVDNLKLIHELQVSQIELTMQNEELKRSEEALRNRNVLMETLLKTLPFGMDIIDETGTVLFQNDFFKEIFGEGAIGQKCWDLYRDDKKQCLDCPLTKNLAVGETETYESHGVLGNRIFDIHHTGLIYQGKKATLEIFQDITDRKQGELILNQQNNELVITNERHRMLMDTLHDSNEYLESLISHASAPIMVWNSNFHITRFNHAFELLSGWTEAEVIGQSPEFLFHAALSTPIKVLLRQALSGKGWESVEIEILNRDKSLRTVLWNSSTVFEKDGRTPIATIVQGQDITDRKLAEQLLMQSEEKFRTLFEKASDGIFIMNINLELAFLNESFARMHGYTLQEMTNINLKSIDTPETSQLAGERIKRTLNGDTLKFEVSHYHKNGNIISLEVITSVILIKAEKYIVAFHRDITERKQAELELIIANKQVEERVAFNNSIIHSTSDWIWEVNEQGIYTYCSEKVEQVLGYTTEEIIGKSPFDFMPEEELKRVSTIFQNIVQAQKPILDLENWNIHKDGTLVCLITNGVPKFDETGKLTGYIGADKDITNRKRKEEIIVHQKQRLSNIIEGTNIGTWEWNIQTGETLFNELWAEFIGYTLEELSPVSIDTWIKYSHPEDLKISGELLEKHFKGELEYYECESRMKHKNGDWIWVLDRGKVHKWDDEGKPILMSGTHQNITKRKEAEETLKESEHNYKERVKELNGVFSLNILSGKSAKPEDIFIEFVNTIVPESMQFPEKVFVSLEIENQKYCNIENFQLPKNLKYLSAPIILLEKQAGELIVAYTEDLPFLKFFEQNLITQYALRISKIIEFKKAGQNLKENEEKLVLLMNSTAESIYGIDLTGNCTYANKTCIESLGYKTEKDLLGRNMHDLIHYSYSDNRPMKVEECKIYLAFKQGKGTHIDDEVLWRADGTSFPAEYYSYPIFKNEEIAGSVVTFSDITERKHAEFKIQQQNSELTKLNADKDRFMSILGHDLRNPFNVLLGLSELLKNDVQEFDRDQIQKMACEINKTARTTYKLLEDILKWAKTQQGNIPFNPQNLNFAYIIKSVLETHNHNALAKNITINYSTPDEIWVLADIEMLKTVLRNLVSNAIKFTDKNGVININVVQTDSITTVSVSDNGVGIEPENLAKLFDVGQVITTMGTSDETGTGLGLLLCKDFVEKHDGNIWVESEVGIGSNFKFTLPKSIILPV